MVENFDKFDEWLAIRQSFQTFISLNVSPLKATIKVKLLGGDDDDDNLLMMMMMMMIF